MTHKIWFDTETFSEVNLKTRGTYAYAANCEVMLAQFAINRDDPHVIDFTRQNSEDTRYFELLDRELRKARDGADVEVWAHHSPFDRNVAKQIPGLYQVPQLYWRDTMIQAYSHGLVGSLGKLCQIFNVEEKYAKRDGTNYIQLFCKPTPKNYKIRRYTSETHPEEWAYFRDQYAVNDIYAMRELHYKMPGINYPGNITELHHWLLDQEINDRGFLVDTELAEGAIAAVKKAKELIKKQTGEQTNGELESTTQRDKMLDYMLTEFGVMPGTLTKADVTQLLAQDLPEPLLELLRLRQQATSTSTAKYRALINLQNDDGRARGTIQFCGAARTGRAAGRKFQPQNLPSRDLPDQEDIDQAVLWMKQGTAHEHCDVMQMAKAAVRSAVIAQPGHKLCISDLANIEGRKVAWFANEEWVLQVFRDYDKGIGVDPYVVEYAKAFNVPTDSVTSQQRSIGKVLSLFLGYNGGAGAFTTGAAGYGFDMDELADSVWDTLPEDTRADAADFLAWTKEQGKSTYDLSDRAFVAADTLKRLWRAARPATVQLWKSLQDGAVYAILNRKPCTVGRVTFRYVNNWLYIDLPSGRCLCYPGAGYDGDLYYWGRDPYTQQWKKLRTYGGKLLENICQASARDVLYAAFPWLEMAGYHIILHVHDEAVTEVPDTEEYSSDRVGEILTTHEPWMAGLPLAAKGTECYSYRK